MLCPAEAPHKTKYRSVTGMVSCGDNRMVGRCLCLLGRGQRVLGSVIGSQCHCKVDNSSCTLDKVEIIFIEYSEEQTCYTSYCPSCLLFREAWRWIRRGCYCFFLINISHRHLIIDCAVTVDWNKILVSPPEMVYIRWNPFPWNVVTGQVSVATQL